MKATKWVIALMLGLGATLSACTKDTVDPDTDPKPEPTGEAYFSFGFSNQDKSKTRSLNTGEETGTIEENQIALVWMLLYDTDGKLKYAYELDATNIDKNDKTLLTEFYGVDVSTKGATATDGFRTVGKKIAVQDYQLVILANPIYYKATNALTGFTESKGVKGSGINASDPFHDLSTLMAINQGEGKAAWDYGDPNGGVYICNTTDVGLGDIEYTAGVSASFEKLFYMSNGNGVISVPASSLQESLELAEQNPSAGVNVDRLFAKIMVNERSDKHTPVLTGGSLQSLTYGLAKRSKDIYPIRRIANAFSSSGTNYEGTEETVNIERKYIYAKTLNFDELDASAFANSTTFVPWNTFDDTNSTVEENNWIYAPENTMPLSVQASDDWAKYTTQVYIKAIIHYNFPSPDADKSYYSWYDAVEDEWVLFSHTMAKAWMASASGSGIDALDALIGTSKNGPFVTGTSSFFSAGLSSNAPATSGAERLVIDTAKDLTFHYKGYNEYFIPIKHFERQYNDTELDRKGVYGHYGIVRNNVYRVVINSINGPGTPLGDSWISADIHVNGWYKRPDQVEDL